MSGNINSTTVAPKPRWKRLLQNLTLSAVVFLLCLVASEIVLRFMGYGNLEIYDADQKLYWRLKPGQDCFTKVDRKPVHVNSQGTRGPEFTVAKPPGTFRILSLGDSRTFGWGLSYDETYSRRLEKLLNDLPGKTRHVEVIDAGVNAWSFSQMAVYFREIGLRYQPDVVVLGEANLWTQFSEKNSPEFVQKFLWRVRLKNFLRRFALYHYVVETKLRDFYERNRTKFIPVDPASDTLFKEEQQSDPDAAFRGEIADICRTAQSNHVKPVLLFLPRLDELNSTNQCRVLAIKQQVGRELSVPVCDVTSGLGDKSALYLEADPVHYNARGNEIVANRLFETVTNVIKP